MPAATLARDAFFLIPHVVLAAWGLLVLLVDRKLFWWKEAPARRRIVGIVALSGVGIAMAGALIVGLVPLWVRADPASTAEWFSPETIEYLSDPDPPIFGGTLAADTPAGYFNMLYVGLLGLVLAVAVATSRTEHPGRLCALLLGSTAAMMLATAAEEFLTLFFSLEAMTFCLSLAARPDNRPPPAPKRRAVLSLVRAFIPSLLFLVGIGLVSGQASATYFDAISRLIDTSGPADGKIAIVADARFSGKAAPTAAIVLLLAGFGLKLAALAFNRRPSDPHAGAPAPVAAWVATGALLATFVALLKVFLHALLPWTDPRTSILGPTWLYIASAFAAIAMIAGNIGALRRKSLTGLLASATTAHAGYMLIGAAGASAAADIPKAAGTVLTYLLILAFANLGAFAVAAWLERDRGITDVEELDGLGRQDPILGTCIGVLVLSLIGIPLLGRFYSMLNAWQAAVGGENAARSTILIGLVGIAILSAVLLLLGYARILRPMYRRASRTPTLAPAGNAIALSIVLGTSLTISFGMPLAARVLEAMQAAAVPMLNSTVPRPASQPKAPGALPDRPFTPRRSPPPGTFAPKQSDQTRMAPRAGTNPPLPKAAGPQSKPAPAKSAAPFQPVPAMKKPG